MTDLISFPSCRGFLPSTHFSMGPPPKVVEGAKKEEDKTEVKEKRPGVFKQGLNFTHCCRRGHKFMS